MQHEKDNRERGGDERLNGCAESRPDERPIRTLVSFRDWARAATDRPEDFWERQRLGVHARLTKGKMNRRWLGAWASAAIIAVVIVALGLLLSTKPQQQPIPDLAAGYDQDLLVDIERSLRRPVPAALEPAMLLAQEVISGSETKSTSSGRRP
jgi:hypothetical protein